MAVIMINAIRFICGWIRMMILILKPAGVKAIAAENIALRQQQLITLSRRYKRSPKLTALDHILFGFLNPKRLSKIAILLKPATILKFHNALIKWKYHLLFSNNTRIII